MAEQEYFDAQSCGAMDGLEKAVLGCTNLLLRGDTVYVWRNFSLRR